MEEGLDNRPLFPYSIPTMKNTYRFSSNHGITTKIINGDKQAFEYALELTDDHQIVPVEKRLNGKWFSWNIQEGKWTETPITDVQVTVNGIPTTIKSNEKVVKDLLSGIEIVIDRDTPISCDPSSETYHCM